MSTDRSVHLHRILRAPPERVYRAFLEPDAIAKWNAPHGFTARVHEMDAGVGGGYRMSFINFATGARLPRTPAGAPGIHRPDRGK